LRFPITHAKPHSSSPSSNAELSHCLGQGWGLEFKRPVCETDGAEHWLAPFHATTKGGWKLDYDAFCLEVIVVASHIFCLLVVPISELAQRGGGGGEGGRRERTGQGDLEGFTGVAVGSLRSAWWFALLAVGGLVFYIGQAVSLFRFGVAWAEGVSMNKHNEVAIGTMLYDHVNAVLYMSLTIGLALGSIIGRWLLAGLSCTSFTIFLIWVLLTVGAFIPPFFVSTYWVFFSFEDSQGQKDCKAIFGDTDFLFARTACDIQAGTYIAAIILILLASLGPVVIGLWDYSRVVCLPRRRAWVDMYAPLLKVRLIISYPSYLLVCFAQSSDTQARLLAQARRAGQSQVPHVCSSPWPWRKRGSTTHDELRHGCEG